MGGAKCAKECTDKKILTRLQDMGEADALAEGIIEWTDPPRIKGKYYGATIADVWEPSARGAFARLWDSLNAKRGYGWDSNPWVWVVEFEKA